MAKLIITPKPVRKTDDRAIKAAVQQARKMSHFVQRALANIWDQPGRGPALWDRRKSAFLADARFTRWLGRNQLGKEQLKKIHRQLRTLDARLHKTLRYEVVAPGGLNCRGGDWAWHLGVVGKRTTFLCRNFLQAGVTVQQRGGVLVHELAHGLGAWKLDKRRAEDTLGAEKLASSRPKTARNNPSNYQFLFRAFDPTNPLT